jgi:hypothetical protein
VVFHTLRCVSVFLSPSGSTLSANGKSRLCLRDQADDGETDSSIAPNRMYRRKHEESGGKNVPEARLYLSLWLGWTLPGGLFIVSIHRTGIRQ